MTPHEVVGLFLPHEQLRRAELERAQGRFVHYTSAEVAMSIIQNNNIWMRNAMTMNDFAEVEHGVRCLQEAWNHPDAGGRLKEWLEPLHPGFEDQLTQLFNGWLPHYRNETYLTCVSEHGPLEDFYGRLSMWRAYGGSNGVALVFNRRPFTAGTPDLKAYSAVVNYQTPASFVLEFKAVVDRLLFHRNVFDAYNRDGLIALLHFVFKFYVLCTKHPGFIEEREWRIIYSPTEDLSPAIEKDFRSVRGVPQVIYKIPLIHAPEKGLVGADIPSLLERVIIGPTDQPATMYKAFVELLTEAKVTDAASKVVVSDIPLRQ